PPPADSVVLVPAGGTRGAASRQRAPARERPALRLATFGALGLYGAIRWGSLLSPAPVWRLLGLFALAMAVPIAAARLQAYRRPLLIAIAIAAAILAFPISGIPVRWITHLRIAVTAN